MMHIFIHYYLYSYYIYLICLLLNPKPWTSCRYLYFLGMQMYVSTIYMDKTANIKIQYSNAYCMVAMRALTAIAKTFELHSLETKETGKSWSVVHFSEFLNSTQELVYMSQLLSISYWGIPVQTEFLLVWTFLLRYLRTQQQHRLMRLMMIFNITKTLLHYLKTEGNISY